MHEQSSESESYVSREKIQDLLNFLADADSKLSFAALYDSKVQDKIKQMRKDLWAEICQPLCEERDGKSSV